MKNNSVHYSTTQVKTCRDMYRPSSNIGLFFKSIMSIIIVGHSPIVRSNYKRRP
ncbi:MAG TPA: hypothetical protein VK616_10760 [Flavitalea sp.]|nr:hypothetical protein [Flavitalea sp.]